MPDLKKLELNLPETQDVPWVDKQWTFSGEWKPDLDPALIGPENFATLQNFRYNDKAIEGVSGYSRVNETTTCDVANGNYIKIRNGIQLRSNRATNSHVLIQALDASGNGKVYQHKGTIDATGEFDNTADLDVDGNPWFPDSAQNLEGRFSQAPQQSVVYCNGKENAIYSGAEHRCAAAFQVTGTPTVTDSKLPKDVTDALSSSLSNSKNLVTFDATNISLLVLTTRPAQGLKFYVNSANTVAATATVSEWQGSSFVDVSATDGTITATESLGQTGSMTWDHTSTLVAGEQTNLAKFFHYEELYLYAYLVTFSAAVDAVIEQMTVDYAMGAIQNVWDGVYRQPIQFQIYNATDKTYDDYTLHVNESSTVTTPVGGVIGGKLTTEPITIMFDEQVSAIRMTMLGTLVNAADAQISTIKYWDGDDYVTVGTFSDGTLDADGDTSFAQSGLISWTAPTDEQTRTLFGTVGYAYEITYDATITVNAVIDICSGIPALTEQVAPFKFSAIYNDRLMMGGLTNSGEGNRMDFSVSNAPEVFNGNESSKFGLQSLYFGGVEELTSATQIYNRFGANIFSMLFVMKDTELFILTGNGPWDYQIYPVSQTVGCPAPMTLAVAEVGFEVGRGLTRNVAMWLSHYGPMMFDGAVLSPIQGINNYFDPNDSDYIEWDSMSKARGWIDQTYKEYNILIPSSTGQSTNNIWLVYDLIRKKWFKKDTGAAETPQCGFNVMDVNTGEQKVYGGIDTGYMIELERGTTWNSSWADVTDGVGIEQDVRTGDFFPSDNIWDFCILRKLKILCKKLPSNASDTTLEIIQWNNASETGSSVSWEDSDLGEGINVDFTDMDVDLDAVNETEWASASVGTVNLALNVGQTRIIRLIQDLNTQGWVHSFEFKTTTTDAVKGWQPLIWGVQFRPERKDNKATQ